MYKISAIDKISFILVIIGSLIWGIYGLFNANIIEALFRTSVPLLERVIYILVGVAGINMLIFLYKTKQNS